jgi:hypothetical protein
MARRPPAATAAAADPAPDAPGAGSDAPRKLSADKTERMHAANVCPGGNGITDPDNQSCGRCESAAKCTVARFAK